MLSDFTFKDTGITVKIKKVSPMLANDINDAIPMPEPPMNEVDYGEPRGIVLEPNYSDPSYDQAVKARNQKVSLMLQRVMIQRAVVVEGEDWKQEVEEYRKFIQEQTGQPLSEPNDLVIYVLRICVGSQEDLGELLTAITRRSQPTQEAIEQAKRSFRS